MKEVISTTAAPEAVGAYSQGIATDDFVFTAGQIALTPDGEFLEDASIADQTTRCLKNVEGILQARGLDMLDVVKVTVFLDDIEQFEAMNEAYAEFFDDEPPARSAIEVAGLPLGAGIEIEAIAARSGNED